MANLYWAAALAVLGLLVVAAPWTFAPVCEVHGQFVQTVTGKQLPMPSGYTARAEVGVGALLLVAAGAVASPGRPRRNGRSGPSGSRSGRSPSPYRPT